MSNLVSSSLKLASLNMLTSVAFRLITFLMNAYVLRRVSGEVLGLINVRLGLLDDTIMFLSREAFRLATVGHRQGEQSWAETINLLWLPLPLSVLVSGLLSTAWIHFLPAPDSPELQEQYVNAVLIVALCGVVQMLAEPPWVAGQVLMFVKVRVLMDTLWVLTRVLVLCLAVTYTPQQVLLTWAAGHALATAFFVGGYYLAFWVIIRVNAKHKASHPNHPFPFSSLQDLLPSLRSWSVSPDQWSVARSFLSQAVVKQVLTEGEKYIMTVFSLLTLSDQGVYDVVANLGSLAARFILRPVEESGYFFFSQLWQRNKTLEEQQVENREKVDTGLFRLFRLSTLFGLLVVSLGVSYSHFLLHLYGGPLLTSGEGPSLLRAQCFLILFFAINGISECFARAAMTEAEINSYTRSMSIMSVAYLVLAWQLTRLVGSIGFVIANCCNMTIRIFLSMRIIRKIYIKSPDNPLSGLLPENDLLFLFLSVGVCCQLSEIWIYQFHPLIHFSLGCVVGVMLLLSIVMREDFILSFLVEKYRGFFVGRNDPVPKATEQVEDNLRPKEE